MDRNARISKHCFGASCCDDQLATAIGKWVAKVPEKTLLLFVLQT